MCAENAADSKLQELYNTTKAAILSENELDNESIRQTLGAVSLAELGVKNPLKRQAGKKDKRSQSTAGIVGRLWGRSEAEASTSGRMTYQHIHEEKALSIGIFCLPRNAIIPLHNHPKMTVFSRVLYGKLHVRSFDWAEPEEHSVDGQRKAKLHADGIVQAGDPPTVLFPHHGGNLHAFRGETDCAVLDLFLPPYDRQEGRDCTYYQEIGPLQPDGTTMLEVFDPPDDFIIHTGTYKGQRIKAHAQQ
ncbi:Plant cysteine oxidase 4 [Coccomyxa sp. Obi]|nr:Plant cysteine oxidase 4 [Coccomyxa sp. Obi]